ncbi:unnamed protein product [marine sediment metagenome]|uniref:Uncharacterized protein n=1 Tax=marine sediment metagenome TaxID=412755 RepID=X0UU90_9ZZZZ
MMPISTTELVTRARYPCGAKEILDAVSSGYAATVSRLLARRTPP